MLIVYDSLINEVNTSVEVYTSILCNNKDVFCIYQGQSSEIEGRDCGCFMIEFFQEGYSGSSDL